MWNQWTKEQRAFVASSLINLSSEEGSAPNKREEVHRAWVMRALDVNDNEFQLHQLPTQEDFKEFSEHIALKRDHSAMALLSSSSSSVKKSTATRTKQQYHTDDANSSDNFYLSFPLMDADQRIENVDDADSSTGITNRKMWAYSEALGVKGKRKVRRQRLQQMIVKAKGAGIPRPENGTDWSTWVASSTI